MLNRFIVEMILQSSLKYSSISDTGKVVGIVIAVLVVTGIVIAALVMASKLASKRQLLHIKINAIDEMTSQSDMTTLQETNSSPMPSNQTCKMTAENSVAPDPGVCEIAATRC